MIWYILHNLARLLSAVNALFREVHIFFLLRTKWSLSLALLFRNNTGRNENKLDKLQLDI